MSIIEKYGYRLTQKSGSQHQVNSTIPIYITRRDLQAADARDNLNGLAPSCRELKLNPVVRVRVVTSPGLNADEIWPEVAVEIRYRKS